MSEPLTCSFTPSQRRLLSQNEAVIQYFGDQYRPLEPECTVIQFDQPLTTEQFEKAAELVADRPDVQLYVYGAAVRDLDFLHYFPRLKRLQIAVYSLEDIAGFAHVADSLEELTYGQTKKAFSLRILGTMPHLKRLFLERHKKDLSILSELTNLTRLGLSGITLPDLSLLLPLKALRELSILLGGTKNLALLARLSALEELWLMRITQLADLDVLGDLTSLKKLKLDWMRNVTSLPNLARLAQLEEVVLDQMKGLTSLEPIAALPALRRLHVFDTPQLTVESFRCLLGHPCLSELWVGTGKRRVNEAVQRMFPGIARY